jgi:hypothetical protein
VIEPAELRDATVVMQALSAEVASSFAEELQIFAMWVESPHAVCVVYRRTIDPDLIIGRRISFPPHARPDNPSSTGTETAEFLREPIGASPNSAQTDAAGITWPGWGNQPLPCTPFE